MYLVKPETKSNDEQLFSAFGVTISDAVIIFLRQSLMNSNKVYTSVAEMNADIDAENGDDT